MAPLGDREVIKCMNPACLLTQFRTVNSLCRRCHKPLDPVEVEAPEPGPQLVEEPVVPAAEGVQVARAVKDLRRRNNLSQRELALRMGVPRTYISKIENEKAMPTLGSLERLARALQVHVSVLLQDENARACEETAVLLADPFLSELLPFVRQMDAMQRSIFLNQARELALGRRRTA